MAPSSWIQSIKESLICFSVFITVLAMKLVIPAMKEFVEMGMLCFQSSMKRTYLYVLVNIIIVAVVASSRFQKSTQPSSVYTPVEVELDHSVSEMKGGYYGQRVAEVEERPVVEEGYVLGTPLPMQLVVFDEPITAVDGGDGVSRISDTAAEEKIETFKYKALHRAEILHRKNSKSMSECQTRNPPQATETLESAWRKITESRTMNKVDTWQVDNRQMNLESVGSQRKSIKSESFNYKDNKSIFNFNPRLSASARTHRMVAELVSDSSQDELNRQAEDFIRKFKEQMRLQREKSMQRGAL